MRSIRARITATYITVALAVILVFGLLALSELERGVRERLTSELRTETNVVRSFLLEASNRRLDRDLVVSSLRSIVASTSMRITLIGEEGTVLFESAIPDSLLPTIDNHLSRPEILAAAREGLGTDSRFSTTVNLPMLYVARAVRTEEFLHSPFPTLRYVRVGLPSTEIAYVVGQARTKFLVVGGIVAVVVVLVSSVLAKRVSRPIVELSDGVTEIKLGNLGRRLPVRQNDEIGKLAETINEMTERLQADLEERRVLERMRSEFLANVSHELRTPLFSLKGFLETLLEGAIDDASVNRIFLEKAYHHANRLDALLADLIEISRIESGEMRMSFRYFEINSLFRQLQEEFGALAQRKNQQLLIFTSKTDLTVYGDKERLRQAISNLLDNAIKYSPAGSTVRLEARQLDSSVRISVADNGPGIEPEHLPRIFERFYRVDKDRSREVGGTGLGLAIVKHIVEAHGSRIAVDCPPSGGTVFMFELKT